MCKIEFWIEKVITQAPLIHRVLGYRKFFFSFLVSESSRHSNRNKNALLCVFIKPNFLDYDYTTPIDLAPNGILVGVKSIVRTLVEWNQIWIVITLIRLIWYRKQNSDWCEDNRKSSITIQIWLHLTGVRKYFSVCITSLLCNSKNKVIIIRYIELHYFDGQYLYEFPLRLYLGCFVILVWVLELCKLKFNPFMPTVAFSQPIFAHRSNICCPRDWRLLA